MDTRVKTIPLPNGGTVTVTVTCKDPDEHLMIKSPQAAVEMAACFMDLASALWPSKKKS